MAERLHISLLIAILIVTAMGVFGPPARRAERAPGTMVLRLGHAPVEWHGWQLIPPSEAGTCEKEGYDSCSDGPDEDDQPLDATDDNEPTSI